ncbi:MAG: OmpA family protein [Puniceicoccales bacterium]|jgi:peptidoglycan-associated lipoprotein|nr:OmpA family protein [Puniceicoccales bacterium]
MKLFSLSLLALAVLATGCETPPANPPAEYGSDAGAGHGLSAFAGGGPGLPTRSVTASGAFSAFDATTGEWDARAVLTIVYFGFDKYNVGPAERAKLDAIAANAQNIRVIVAGYTDRFGTDQYNHGLSDRRAQSVKQYLVGLGVPEANIEIQAFGKQYAKPSGSRSDLAGDRRAVVVNASYQP